MGTVTPFWLRWLSLTSSSPAVIHVFVVQPPYCICAKLPACILVWASLVAMAAARSACISGRCCWMRFTSWAVLSPASMPSASAEAILSRVVSLMPRTRFRPCWRR